MMELFPRLLVGFGLACLANAINNGIEERPTIAPSPPWRGSAILSSSSNAYETPTSSADEHSSLEPYTFYDTAYPVPSISDSSTPHPHYSAIVTVRTTTWVLSRSTTITSIILETYYSTLTDIESSIEAGTVTVTTTSTECTAASGYASVYASGCPSSSTSTSTSTSSSSSSSSSSSRSMVTMTWSPEVTAYPLPSTDEGRSPASTSATSSGSTTTTTTASSGNETPPVVTGGAGSAPQAAELRTFGVVAALLAMLL